jgi:DNA polymerase-3 subunit epsilon
MDDAPNASARIRYCALLDTETTGLSPATDRTIEVAVALFDLKHAEVVASFASLIKGEAKNESEEANNIPPTMLPEAREPELVWRAARWIIEPAQVVIAHNADFDKQFTPDLGKPWVCSENDIKWPGRARGGSLVHLALSLGLGVAHAHRAMSDVDTLARVLTRLAALGHELEPIIVHAMRPKVMCHSLAPFEQKDVVKNAGFRWDGDRKVWWRRMPLEDTEALPFKVRVVQ